MITQAGIDSISSNILAAGKLSIFSEIIREKVDKRFSDDLIGTILQIMYNYNIYLIALELFKPSDLSINFEDISIFDKIAHV